MKNKTQPDQPKDLYSVILDGTPHPVEATSIENAVELAKRKQTDSEKSVKDELTAESTNGKR